jgi:nitroreductase
MKQRAVIKKYFSFLIPLVLLKEYAYDYKMYLNHSAIKGNKSNSKRLIAIIMEQYHIVEKGLTMPETRLGFGYDNLISLIDNCLLFQSKYDKVHPQLKHAVEVIFEYQNYHEERSFELSDFIKNKISELEMKYISDHCSTQLTVKSEDYFNHINSSFEQFSNSRRSVRNYSDSEIPNELIIKSVDLSRNAPSSCNRQAVKANVVVDKDLINKVLEIQGGNKGFGHLSNKIIIVTADLSVCQGVSEKHQVYVDGGMYAMNLLYSLHQNKIVACALNCNFTKSKDLKIRKILNIPASEVFIVIFSCGFAPDEFKIALSERNPVSEYIRII